MKENVSVIIPTYNRAHLLEKTIPTYLQENVKEIIIVNDASTDNTHDVLIKLKKKYPIIKIVNLLQNSKQTYSKNIGMEYISSNISFVYFGDDDSILLPNSMKYLLETIKKYKADLVGAKALYLKCGEDEKNIIEILRKVKKIELVKAKRKSFNNFICAYDVNEPIEVLTTYACFLVKKEILGKVKFSLDYKVNCYREETDFTLNIHKLGKKLMYDSRACQINLPRKKASGGAHKKGIIGKFKWYYWAIKNNNLFIEKHYEYLKVNHYILGNKFFFKVRFIISEGINILLAGLRKIKY